MRLQIHNSRNMEYPSQSVPKTYHRGQGEIRGRVMLLSIKTKLKLNKSQEILMVKHAGIARLTYNWRLSVIFHLYPLPQDH